MPLDVKKIYYYALCGMAFFALMWGAIDFASSSLGLALAGPSEPSNSQPALPEEINPQAEKNGEQTLDVYYQKKMLGDRLWDSFARVVVSGAIFAYCRVQAKKTEEKA